MRGFISSIWCRGFQDQNDVSAEDAAAAMILVAKIGRARAALRDTYAERDEAELKWEAATDIAWAEGGIALSTWLAWSHKDKARIAVRAALDDLWEVLGEPPAKR